MRLVNFLKDFFGSSDTVNISEYSDSQCTKMAIDTFTLQVAINLIAKVIAKCEFKTFVNGKAVKGDEFYIWNIQPNVNQNSTEFLQELVYRLIYENEVLIVGVNDQLIIADSFSREEYAIKEDYFTRVSRKGFDFNRNFNMSDVIYLKFNNENIRGYINNLMAGYGELLEMAESKYKRAGGRKGVAKLDTLEKGNEEQKKKKRELINKKFKTYFESENAVLTLSRGEEYEEQNSPGNQKNSNELNDIRNLIDDAINRICQALSIPIGLLKGDIADIEAVTNNFLTFCIEPIIDLLETEINAKRYGKKAFLSGSCLKIDTTNIKHIDVFSVAEKCDKLIANGMYSIDELRGKLKDTILNEDWSQKHWITKNYQGINEIIPNTGGE